MGQSTAEQTALIIDSVANVIEKSQPPPEPSENYWWLLLIAVVPVVIGVIIKRLLPDKPKTPK